VKVLDLGLAKLSAPDVVRAGGTVARGSGAEALGIITVVEHWFEQFRSGGP
jgi:hypothetical protein